MHWWIKPRHAVQSGMFCCGRSKGEEESRNNCEDPHCTAPTSKPSSSSSTRVASRGPHAEQVAADERYGLQGASDSEQETHRLISDDSGVPGVEAASDRQHAQAHQFQPGQLQQQQHTHADSRGDAERDQLSQTPTAPRRPRPSRPLSDPVPGRVAKLQTREASFESPRHATNIDQQPKRTETHQALSQKTRDAAAYQRSTSYDEAYRDGVPVQPTTSLTDGHLDQASSSGRYQLSEQRIQHQQQHHHDLADHPSQVGLIQQQQPISSQQYTQQQQRQQHWQSRRSYTSREGKQRQQQQQQQQQQHPSLHYHPRSQQEAEQLFHHQPPFEKKHQYSFSEPFQFDPEEQQRKFFQQLEVAQRQHQREIQLRHQQELQQQQHQQQKQQHQQQKTTQQRRSSESLSSDRSHSHEHGYEGGQIRSAGSPPSYHQHTRALIGNNTGGRHVYANVPRAGAGEGAGAVASGPVALEMGIKSMEVEDDSFVVETVEIIKRPGQTLGFYIREGNGFDRSDGVFISRIQMGTVAQTNGLLHVGDEIVTVNNVKVGNMSLDDVVILMSIPKKLVLTIRTRRNSNKNKSCPSLPMAEKQDPPVVVLKKGRSSSASALEMTEKCPDMYEPGQTYSQYPFQTADYLPRRDLSQERQGQTSRYASIFISPQRAEAKLVNEDGLDSSNSSDGSLPRSIDSGKDRPYMGQEVVDASHSGYMSVTNPIYDHFSALGTDVDYKHRLSDGTMRKSGAMPKSPSKQVPLGNVVHLPSYRSRISADASPAHSEPPYMNVGMLREGILQHPQQQQQQHQHPHSQSHYSPHQSSTYPSHGQPAHHYPYAQGYPSQGYPSPQGALPYTHGATPAQPFRSGMTASQEERRRQEKLRSLLNSKSRYGRILRSRSPECYNSDSELIFTHQQPSDGRGFASDYETYGGAFSDDEPVYSIPRVPSSSSSELEMLLKKFTTLSQELQQEQSKLQRQLSTREKGARGGQLSLSRAESLSGDEYGGPSLVGQGSPGPIRRAASTQTPTLPPRLSRHPGAAEVSSYLYSTYQHESHPDLVGRGGAGGGAMGVSSVTGGLPLSTSQTSIQMGKQQTDASTGVVASSSPSSSASRPPAGRLRDLHLTRKPLHIPYSEFEPYKADMRKRMELTRVDGLDGLLSIHIMSGQGLKSSKTSLRDLYCVVAVDSLNKARTMIRTGAINFDWDEAFDVDLEDSKEVSFLIYHWDPHYKHRLCFHGSILLPGYVNSGHRRYVAIKLEPKGILFVTLLYKEPAISLQRLPSVKKNALFGVELETIILRETSGLNVPIIVHKCVQEVERRGLDTVGIYRLCGSARRKAMLREAFESNAKAVDLSPENISDIHVITGVLKDYLRELPEPLFTNALYQMLLDALSVRLPCDPEGSAKLMLSILECLPSTNQDTMALLLNHLRRVASHSDKNKMPIDNLAICFGPVLLCPAPSSNPDPLLDFRKHIEVLKYLLEIWDFEGSSSTSKSPTADTVVSVETSDSPQQTGPSSSEYLAQQTSQYSDSATEAKLGNIQTGQ